MHYARNLLANVPKNQVEFVAAAFRSIFALGTVERIVARWDEVAATLEERFPKAAASMQNAKADLLAIAGPSGDIPDARAAVVAQSRWGPQLKEKDTWGY